MSVLVYSTLGSLQERTGLKILQSTYSLLSFKREACPSFWPNGAWTLKQYKHLDSLVLKSEEGWILVSEDGLLSRDVVHTVVYFDMCQSRRD